MHDPVQQSGAELVAWECSDPEGEERLRSDHIDVAQRVGRRDRPKLERVVDDGREEIDGGDERAVGRDSVHSRVISGRRGVQDVGVDDRRERAEYLTKLDRAELASAPGAMAVFGQAHRGKLFGHLVSIDLADRCQLQATRNCRLEQRMVLEPRV